MINDACRCALAQCEAVQLSVAAFTVAQCQGAGPETAAEHECVSSESSGRGLVAILLAKLVIVLFFFRKIALFCEDFSAKMLKNQGVLFGKKLSSLSQIVLNLCQPILTLEV